MELKWLEDLIALFDEKSISRAADSRHVTQPAYSRRIKQLEEWLGIEIVDRSTKPIGIRPTGLLMEREVRELVNRLYALRNKVHESQTRVTFVVQHTLAVSKFPKLIQQVTKQFPDNGFRVIPANNDDCESLFLKEGGLLLCYETNYQRVNFSNNSINKVNLGNDYLLPVASREMATSLGKLITGMKLPVLTYPKGGFMANSLDNTCMPSINRNYRVELICESAFSASLKEMVLSHMGIAWLAQGMIKKELASGDLISYQQTLGSVELDILLFCNENTGNEQISKTFEIIRSL